MAPGHQGRRITKNRNDKAKPEFTSQLEPSERIMPDRTPPGQRTETTSPYLAIVGAIVIIGFGIFAFSFWPYSDTLSTDPTGNIPKNQQGTSTAPGSPPQPK